MAEDLNNLLPWTDPKVNNDIVSSTINYYGHGLLKQLADTKRHLLPYAAMKDINYQSFKARAHKLGEPDEVKLYTTSVDFILNNADFLFSQSVSKSVRAEDSSKYGFKDKYKNLPPLDYYLQTNKKMKAVQFHKTLRRGDLLVCRAMQSPRGSKYQPLRVVFRDAGPHMFCGKNLYLNVNLDISQTRVPKIDEGSVPNTWTTNTLVRVEVLSVTCEADFEKADVVVGTMGDTLLENNRPDVSLGKVNRSDVPEIVNAMDSYTKESVGGYDANVKKMESFKNPRCVQHLAKQLNLSLKNTSLMSTLRNDFVAPSRYKQLRRLQLTRWAHKHVADGVAHFKKGEHAEAFQLLNKALSIDTENVEAFVAKGALLANMGSFEKAVEDFESALKYNPEHGNARKYICETLLELGKRHEDEGKLGAAESCYARSLQVNAKHGSSLEALSRLHARAGFKSSLALDFLKKKETNDGKKECATLARDETPKTKASVGGEENEITVISDHSDEETPFPSAEQGKPRERSLSPLAQKLAMQNNAWKPPSFIDTNNSFLNTAPTQSVARSDVHVTAFSTKSDAHVLQTNSYTNASTSKTEVRIPNTDSETASTKAAIYTLASNTESRNSSSQSDFISSMSKAKASKPTSVAQTSTASDPFAKPAAEVPKPRKESISIAPFVVGANQSAAAAAATAAATAPDGIIDQVSSVLVSLSTSSKLATSSGPSVSQVSSTTPVSAGVSVAPVAVVSSVVGSSADTGPSVLPVATVSAPTNAPTTHSSDGRGTTMLDRNFHNAMKVKPKNSDEVEVLSLTLIMLCKKFKAIGNNVRARLCLEKSLKHNPKHEPTKLALQQLNDPSASVPKSSEQQPESNVATSASASQQPISVVPHYQVPPPGFPGFSVPPPNYMGVPPPNQLGMSYPPPLMAGGYGLPYGAPPNVTEPPPGYSNWGTSLGGQSEASGVQSQLSQEDKEYHEKVESFLKQVINRSSSRRSKSSSRSLSPESPRSSRRRSPRASSPGKSRSRHERRSPHNKSPRRDRWNPDQKRGLESRERRSQSPRDWRGKSRENRLRSQDRQSPVRDRLPHLRAGRPSPLNRPSPDRGRSSRSLDRRSRSRSPLREKKKATSRSASRDGKLAKPSSRLSKSKLRDDDDKSDDRSSKKRHKEVKKKKRRNRSSSSRSSSSSSYSSSGGSHSSAHSKRNKKKKKSKKQRTIPKINLKGLDLADDPALQNIDKELLRKISEKLYQSNFLLGEVKDVGKKKKRKRTKDSETSDSDDQKEKKKKKNAKEIAQKSANEDAIKKKRKSSETLKDSEKVSMKEKTGKTSWVDKRGKKRESLDENTAAKAKEEQMELLEKEKLKEIAQKYLVNSAKKPAIQAPKEDNPRQSTEEETSASIQRLMQLPGLEDLQKKLKSYYTKCKNNTEEPPESKDDLTPLKLKPSNYLVKKTAHVSSSPAPNTKNSSISQQASAPLKFAVKHDAKSPVEVLSSSASAGKPAIDANVPSVFKSALQSVITQSKKEPLVPMGPATPELLKRRSSLDAVAPPSAATISNIGDPAEDTKSRFKSTFQPVMSEGTRFCISKMRLLNADGSIITPSEFKAGVMSKAQETRDAVIEKAQNVAENISKHREKWKPDASKKLSEPGPLSGRSRSRSKSRGRRSKSRSRRRSRSSDRRHRSRSRDRSPPHLLGYSRRGYFDRPQIRPQRGARGCQPRGGFSHSQRRGTRSRSNSPSRHRRRRSRSRGSRSPGRVKRSPVGSSKSGPGTSKDSMFGKWMSDGGDIKHKSEGLGKSLEEMQKFLAESKEKKVQKLKDRNLVFQKPPDN